MQASLKKSKRHAEVYNKNPHPANTILSALHITNDATRLPIHPHLLTICHRSNQQTRPVKRSISCSQTPAALPSLGRLGLRPCSINNKKMQLTDIHCHRTRNDGHISIEDKGDAEPQDNRLFSTGIHPWYINDEWQIQFARIREYAQRKNAVAIGECGFDLLKSPATVELQRTIFAAHIALSEETKKPLIIHLVKGTDELFRALKEHRHSQPWIIHGFRGKETQAQQLIAAGLYLSFGERFNKSAAACTPLHRLFVESDESQVPLRDIYHNIAAAKDISTEELAKAVKENCKTSGLIP